MAGYVLAALVSAMVIHIPPPVSVVVFLRRNRTIARTASEKPRIRKQVALRVGASISSQERLGTFEFVERNHRLVPCRVPFSLEDDMSGVKRPFQDLVDASPS